MNGLFGSSAPRQDEREGGPRWWDYVLNATMKGQTPQETSYAHQDRQIAAEERARQRALDDRMMNMVLGPNGGSTAAPAAADPASRVTAYREDGTPVTSVTPEQRDRMMSSAGFGAARDAAAAAAPAAAPGGGGGQQAAATNAVGSLLHNADGSLRSRQQVLADPRYAAAMTNPRMAAMLAPFMEAAEGRAPKWEFQNGQWFNVNSDDVAAGSRRVGTAIDANTGMYSDVGPDGRVTTRQSEGFNEINADRIESDRTALGRGENATYRDQQIIDLEYKPQIARRTQDEQNRSNLEYAPQIAGATTRETEAAQAPYRFETVQTHDGPMTIRRDALGQRLANGETIQGRGEGQINAANAANSEANEFIQGHRTNIDTLSNYRKMIEDGDLNLSWAGNIVDGVRMRFGVGSEQSRNLEMFRNNIDGIVNKVTALQTGPQTDADVQRIRGEILSNMTDERYVTARLQELENIYAQAVGQYEQRILSRGGTVEAPVARAGARPSAAQMAAERARRFQ